MQHSMPYPIDVDKTQPCCTWRAMLDVIEPIPGTDRRVVVDQIPGIAIVDDDDCVHFAPDRTGEWTCYGPVCPSPVILLWTVDTLEGVVLDGEEVAA